MLPISDIFYSVRIVLRQREQILSIHSEQSLCCIQNSQKSQAIRHIRYKVKSAVQCNPSIVNLFVRAKLSTIEGYEFAFYAFELVKPKWSINEVVISY